MRIVEKIKKSSGREEALKEIGKYLDDRLSELGSDYGDVSGAYVGTFLASTEKLLDGKIDKEHYDALLKAAALSYEETVSERMKGFKSDVDELRKEILTELPNLRNLKKSSGKGERNRSII